MLCIVLALSISSNGIEILDHNPDEWLAEGWMITEEIVIDPTIYFETLTFPPADLLQCNTSFIESNGTQLWRAFLLYNDKCVRYWKKIVTLGYTRWEAMSYQPQLTATMLL